MAKVIPRKTAFTPSRVLSFFAAAVVTFVSPKDSVQSAVTRAGLDLFKSKFEGFVEV